MAKKDKKPVVSSSSEDSSSSDTSSDSAAAPPKVAKAASSDSSSDDSSSDAPAAKATASDSSDDSSSDEKPAPKQAAAKKKADSSSSSDSETSAKGDDASSDSSDSSSDSSESDDEAAKKANKKKETKKRKPEADDDDDDDQEGAPKQAKKASKTSHDDDAQANRGVFVGNLAWTTTEDDLWEFFKECGEIAAVRVATDRETGRARGFAHVDFVDPSSVEKACELNGESLNGRNTNVNPADQKPAAGASRTPRTPRDESKTIFVKGFDKYLGEDEVRKQLTEAFNACGDVVNVRLPTFPDDGNLKGIAFVEFGSEAAKDKAAELNEQEDDV